MKKNETKTVEISPVEHDFSSIIGELGLSFGLNRTVGQIYGLLYVNEKPVSLIAISKKLSISKGSASLNIRELERWGAVKKVWTKGTRQDFYEVEADFTDILYKRIKLRLEKVLNLLNSNITGLKEKSELNTVQNKRLEEIKKFQQLCEKLMNRMPGTLSLSKINTILSVIEKLKFFT
jgi:DNA-binding transcriptional regulator GbsR (MarR family)